LSSQKLKEKVFFYLKIKEIADGLYLLILSVNYLPNIIDSCFNCYVQVFYNLYFMGYFRKVFILFTAILEIIIAINRYFLIRSKTKILVRQKDKLLVLYAAFFSLLFYFPNIFLFLIVKEKTDRPDNFYIFSIPSVANFRTFITEHKYFSPIYKNE